MPLIANKTKKSEMPIHSAAFPPIMRAPATETKMPSPRLLPPEVLKGVTLNSADESS